MSDFIKAMLLEGLEKISGRLGSNSGGKYRDEDTGEMSYRKTYRNGDQAKVEALTGKIHSLMGIKGFEPKYEHEDGEHVISTKWKDDIRPSRPSDYKSLTKTQADQLATMHHAAVLTKNWDIVGMEHDNIMKDDKGDFSSIDHGGAFHFRAQGGAKNYSPDIAEHSSLINNHEASGHVFGEVKKQHPTAFSDTIGSVKNLDPVAVHKAFSESGLHNAEELHDTFNKRKALLIDHYK